jgi:hypothetical protein
MNLFGGSPRRQPASCSSRRPRWAAPPTRRGSRFVTSALGLLLATGLTAFAACSDSTSPAGPSGGNGTDASDAGGAAGFDSGATPGGDAGGTADNDATSGNDLDGSGMPDAHGAEEAGGDSAVGGLTLPIQRDGGLDVLEFGPLQFAVNPAIGARIVSFKLDGDELLTDATVNSTYWGSTLWTSPVTDWQGLNNGLPPAATDTDPYATTVSAAGVITATSDPETINGKTFTVTKVFTADIPNQAIVIDYEITNTGTAAFSIAAWEVTRVFPNGLTFFPTGTTMEPNISTVVMPFQEALGDTWYDNSTQARGNGDSQAFFDTPGGYLAHDAPNASGDLLFIKTFPVITVAMAPPGQLPAALYTTNDPDPNDYEEIEEHSAYSPIAVGATYTQTVHWYLRRLPVGTDRSVGSAALVAAVKAVIGK